MKQTRASTPVPPLPVAASAEENSPFVDDVLRYIFEDALIATSRAEDLHLMGCIAHAWPRVSCRWYAALWDTTGSASASVKAMWWRIAEATSFPLLTQWGLPCATVATAMASWHSRPRELLVKMRPIADYPSSLHTSHRLGPFVTPPYDSSVSTYHCWSLGELLPRDSTESEARELRNRWSLLTMIVRAFMEGYARPLLRHRCRASPPALLDAGLCHGVDVRKFALCADFNAYEAHHQEILNALIRGQYGLHRHLTASLQERLLVSLEWKRKTVHLAIDCFDHGPTTKLPTKWVGKSIAALVDRLIAYTLPAKLRPAS